MTRAFFSLILACMLALPALSQKKKTKIPPHTPGIERLKNDDMRAKLHDRSIANGLRFKNVGPTIMSGRVVDLAVNPEDPTHFYVAYASGGLWYTENNGTSFEPVFDSEIVLTIGAIAVDWKSGNIWVGTGEVNSSRSSYAGTGVYRSTDAGKTWEYRGLPESHHIGRIVLHPENPNTCWVAVLGHLYSDNPERGVYKTTDGGQSWTQSLAVNAKTGAVDLEIDANNPNHLFAATWERERKAWNFSEGGENTGVYESVDGGTTWQRISTAEQGFPQGSKIGRVGITLHSGTDLHLYAIIDNQNERPEDDEEKPSGLQKEDFKDMTVAAFAKISNADLQDYLEENGFPDKYDTTRVRDMVQEGKITPVSLFEYLTDANADLFDKPIIGPEVYHYNFTNRTWMKTHEGYLDDVVYTYGYYFGLIEVSASNPDILMAGGVPMLLSKDGGKTWTGANTDNLHADHHVVWINPDREGHIINGNDGGVNISYDFGETYVKCNHPSVGQFYTVNVDYADNYNVYGGLQDNGVWKGPHDYEFSDGWRQDGRYPYEFLMGGDGMQVEIDNRDNSTVYTGYQFGHYYRLGSGDSHYFHPKHELGERPLRWNWQTPIHLSRHNQDILYMGSNRFHRSMDQGETFETLSDDLTYGGRQGDVPYGTISSITESPLQFGLLYVGTDDGRVHISRDGGNTWEDMSARLPTNMWVSRVIASGHAKGRVYLALNGYRWDHFDAMIYVSDNYGDQWTRIGQDLPYEPVNVIKEDPENEDILYVGTDNGIYVSMDRGKSFMTMDDSLPPVAVHDLVIQEDAHDLVIGTHGRSIYIANIEDLQNLKPNAALELFAINPIKHRSSWGNAGWSKWYGYEEPHRDFNLFAQQPGEASFTLETDSGLVVKSWTVELEHKGFNTISYDLTIDPESVEDLEKELQTGDESAEIEKADNDNYYLPIGRYTLKISKGSLNAEQELLVE